MRARLGNSCRSAATARPPPSSKNLLPPMRTMTRSGFATPLASSLRNAITKRVSNLRSNASVSAIGRASCTFWDSSICARMTPCPPFKSCSLWRSIRRFPKASLYLGLAYLANGQQAEALKALERAAANNPRDPDAHYRLARMYSIQGEDEKAERQYKIYDEVRETERLVEGEGHTCMDALREKPIEQAREICGRLADQNDGRRMLLLGQLYAGKGLFSDAIDPLRAAVRLDPDSFDGWHNLGLSLFWLRRYEEALPALKQAARLNSQYFDTLNLLAATYHALGDDAAALPILEQAHALNPSDTRLAAALDRMRAAHKK